MDDIVKEFLVESYENLDRLDRAMVELEKDPRHKPSLDSIFRTIHTIKGTCGFIGFGRLEKLAHTGENLLSRVRDGKLTLTTERASALLAMVDAVRQALAAIESTGQETNDNYAALIERLARLTEADGAPGPAVAAPTPAPAPTESAPVAAPTNQPAPAAATPPPATPQPSAPPAPVPAPAPTPTATPAANVVPEAAQPAASSPTAAAPAPAPTPAAASAAPAKSEAPAAKSSGLSDSTIRVDVHVLDKLMNLVGELVLARNQILQFTETSADKTYLNACQRLNLITSEIQENFMKTRMQPIANVFGKFPRIIRDLSAELGKRIRLETSGNETELDRTIIEAIKDPLTHIVRNSVDHGIEKPDARVARGKNPEGVLALHAYHEGGQVNIEIVDDGAGINVERVKQKAVEKGLLAPDRAARMSDREAFNLIFLPGFSTAEKVTNVSGRGVGMDVVKTNIEKIGGSFELQSESGKGTTLKIKIPLTLAILPALIVTTAGERFAIPQASLLELLRLDGAQARQAIESVLGAPVYRLRGELLPLVFMNRALKLETKDTAARDCINIVVLQADGRQFGLVVDKINDTQEIVVKPLDKHLKGIPVFAGATIMGDGSVALILDVLGIAQLARVVTGSKEAELDGADAEHANGLERRRLLLCTVGQRTRLAIPLTEAWRLEEFPRTQIEYSGRQEVVQYRGQIMRLIRLGEVLEGTQEDWGENQRVPVVVYSVQGRGVGLVVGKIVDTVEDSVAIEEQHARHGVLGSAIIQGKVTELLDVPALVGGING